MNKTSGKAIYEDSQKPDLTGQIGSISRDPFGGNPLYYIDSEKGFFWASKMKDLIPFVKEYDLDWTLNEEVLFEYFMFRYTAGRNTLIKEVKRVLPGELILFDTQERGINKRTYYDWEEKAPEEMIDSEDRAINFIENKLVENIKEMFTDDSAIILSGGVDSSLLVALTSKYVKKEFDTISTVFFDEQEDEHLYSSFVANKYNTRHTNFVIDSHTFGQNYLEAVWHNDEPINFANSVAIMMMSKFAKEKGFNKIMAGEGADEVFAGYGFFDDPRPLWLRTQYVLASDIFNLLNSKTNSTTFLEYRMNLLDDNPYTGVSGDQWYTFYTYLQTVLNRLNKMTVSQDIEAPCPYFTLDMIEDIFYLIPDNLKVKDGTTKYILKKLAEKYFDKDFVHRKKVGFGIPINNWLRDKAGLGRYVKILLEDRTLSRSIYNADGIRHLVNALYNKKDSETFTIAGRIWILLNLEMWIRTFVEEKSKLNL